jgi:hypothetical protein
VAALRFAPPLTKVLAAIHNASKAASSDGFLGVRVALFRVVNGRIFRSENSNGLDWYMSSGVGLSRSLPAFYVENALVHICRCGRRVGDRGSMLLARLSSAGGSSVRYGAHVDAC